MVDDSRSPGPGAWSTVFAPLDQLGRAEAVTRRLTDAITGGLLGEGEQLPSESELADRLGVSTVTVREALVSLRHSGLVETRRGRGGGSFVRTPTPDEPAHRRERITRMTLTEIRDLGDHYAAIAGTAARLAAQRASPEDVDRIAAAIDANRADGPGAVQRAERAFHLEIAAAAQSARLTRQEVRIQGESGAVLWLPDAGVGACRATAEIHSAILGAIADADGDRARSLTDEHVQYTVERLAALRLDAGDG